MVGHQLQKGERLPYSKELLLDILGKAHKKYGRLPTRRELQADTEFGVSENPFRRVFGGWGAALETYTRASPSRSSNYVTTLVVPDAHVGPEQDLGRFDKLGALIAERQPNNVVFLGDFVTLESLSNWDQNKSGIMEGRRYIEDIEAGKEALRRTTEPLKKCTGYAPRLVFIYGNHEKRICRYLETKPELRHHLDLNIDLGLAGYGITDIVDYRESIEIEGVLFTHAPQNAANQPVSGKYAVHRAAEMTAKSIVFGHTHRKEGINYKRHGSDQLTQVATAGAYFEHTDSYAVGGLNSYWRGVCILTHWAPGRFDTEEISLERLTQSY